MSKTLEFAECICKIIEELYRRTRLCNCKSKRCTNHHTISSDSTWPILFTSKDINYPNFSEINFKYIFNLDNLYYNEGTEQIEINYLFSNEKLPIESLSEAI